MRTRSEVISFRCPIELAQQIDKARRPLNISRGDWTRSVAETQIQNPSQQQTVIDQLDEINRQTTELAERVIEPAQIAELGKQLSHLLADTRLIIRNLSRATGLLLTRRDMDEREAEDLVRRKLGNGGTKP